MVVGIVKETGPERRVSMSPESVAILHKKGIQVLVEKDAGQAANYNNDAYALVGATVVSQSEIIQQADVILAIHAPDFPISSGKVLIGMYAPLQFPERMASWRAAGVTAFSMDRLPRTTRAQSMDVLSSQANIAGYKAVLLAAHRYSRYFPMFMTAAGSIPPAKVLILGAGVAGLQAIATARRLGAVVEVFDTRPAVKEEVMSLGAKFIEVQGAADASAAGGYAVEQSADFVQRQEQQIAAAIAKADIVITTAQIPGKKAPLLITDAMLQSMRQGSVIVDLAAATGGNTPVTIDQQTVCVHGVEVIGDSSLAASMPADASKLYGKNILQFLQLLINKDGQLDLQTQDDLVVAMLKA
jgi:H+-translocating NAD(P) transhydrogenase subunit alpha